jgi:hypothetical protein
MLNSGKKIRARDKKNVKILKNERDPPLSFLMIFTFSVPELLDLI